MNEQRPDMHGPGPEADPHSFGQNGPWNNAETARRSVKWFTIDSIIASVIAIVIGMLFILLPDSFASLLCTIVSILLIIGAIVMLIAFFANKNPSASYALAGAIVLCAMGIFGVTHVSMLKGVLSYFFGIFIIIVGSIYLAKCIQNIRYRIGGSNLFQIVLSLIILVLGIVVLFVNFSAMLVATGIIIACVGLAALIMSIMFAVQAKKTFRQNTPLDSQWHEVR